VGAADLARLVVLAAVWGLAFVFIRVAVPPLGPVTLTELRALIAGVVLAIYAQRHGTELRVRSRWPRYLVLAFFGGAAPFVLIAAAEEAMTASFAVVMVSTAPLFGAGIAAAWAGERLTVQKVGGLVLGVAGVALLVGWKPSGAELPPAWAIAATLGAAAMYGIASVYAKLKTSDIPPMAAAAGNQLGAAVLLAPIVPIVPPTAPPSAIAWACVLALALLSSAFALVLYFRLIANVGPVKTLTVNFLTPLFGVAGGALLLGEPVTANLVAGTAVILGGTALVLRSPAPQDARG
jgi:drug/metabolite transporter (DMT)-like permease